MGVSIGEAQITTEINGIDLQDFDNVNLFHLNLDWTVGPDDTQKSNKTAKWS